MLRIGGPLGGRAAGRRGRVADSSGIRILPRLNPDPPPPPPPSDPTLGLCDPYLASTVRPPLSAAAVIPDSPSTPHRRSGPKDAVSQPEGPHLSLTPGLCEWYLSRPQSSVNFLCWPQRPE